MADTDKKILKLFVKGIGVIGLITRMPTIEAHREIESEWPNGLAHIDGEDELGNHNVTVMARSEIIGFVVVVESKVQTLAPGSAFKS